jgi:hypothetical protein
MMTRAQRLSFIEKFKGEIQRKKNLLEQFRKDEQAISEFVNTESNGSIALSATRSFLIPQRDQIGVLTDVIAQMENQLEKWNDPAIETMSDEDAVAYINS